MAVYLSLIDFLVITEANTTHSAADLADNDEVVNRALTALWAPAARMVGVDVYDTIPRKAAALEFTLIRLRPLPSENVVVAHECMKEFAWINGMWMDWTRSTVDVDRLFRDIVAAEPTALASLTVWLQTCLVDR